MNLLKSDIELKSDSTCLYDIYSDDKGERPTIYAERKSDGLIKTFVLTKDKSKIMKENRDEILEYCLGKVTPNEVVFLGDIFMHSQYVKEIRTEKKYHKKK